MNTNYPESYRVLGLRIAYYRKKARYTQETFAEKIDKSANFVAQIEGPGMTRGISLETLFKMAEVLNISPSKFFLED
ncbi:MAG: helix-turn-helix domain-containing protein [Oscillospiraceae bacterium]|jgi:transcriptional regulator with XRE-family HTH domain